MVERLNRGCFFTGKKLFVCHTPIGNWGGSRDFTPNMSSNMRPGVLFANVATETMKASNQNALGDGFISDPWKSQQVQLRWQFYRRCYSVESFADFRTGQTDKENWGEADQSLKTLLIRGEMSQSFHASAMVFCLVSWKWLVRVKLRYNVWLLSAFWLAW